MTKLKRIPQFKTIREEAKFWDTHDVTDFLPLMKKEKIGFLKPVAKKETLNIRVQPKLKKRLEKVAQNYGISVSSLMRIWFIDKLKKAERSRLSV